jgi:hypothetical protein
MSDAMRMLVLTGNLSVSDWMFAIGLFVIVHRR